MRSRYSAYVLGLLDYLLATWHPSTAPGDLELDAVKWLGLEVKAAAAQGDAGSAGAAGGGASGAPDDVVDAEFTEVKDDDRK